MHTDELWEALFEHSSSHVREIGMQLFGKLSETALIERAEILASFCLSEKQDIRRAARPIVERLAGLNAGFAQDMVLQFYPLTLRAESTNGIHQDVYELLTQALDDHLSAIPVDSCFRMMESRYAAGQMLGFRLLEKYADLQSVDMRVMGDLPVVPFGPGNTTHQHSRPANFGPVVATASPGPEDRD